MRHYGVLCAAACLLAGCSPSVQDTRAAEENAIHEVETKWGNDMRAKDLDKWMNYYASDGVVLMPNAPAITGLDNIRAALKPMLADPNFSLTFQATKVEVAKSGDLAYAQGTYSMQMTDPKTNQPVTDRGKYITVFRKQSDGGWKVAQDMISSDMPAPTDSH